MMNRRILLVLCLIGALGLQSNDDLPLETIASFLAAQIQGNVKLRDDRVSFPSIRAKGASTHNVTQGDIDKGLKQLLAAAQLLDQFMHGATKEDS